MNISVIGAGNCGQAMTAHLISLGYKVKLYDINSEAINLINKNGIVSKGVIEGTFQPEIATTNIEKTLHNADVILIAVPASSHKSLAEDCAPHLQNNQIIILNPGRTFGALEFLSTVKKTRDIDITIAETQTALYTARRFDTNKVEIITLKQQVSIASIPAENINSVIEIFRNIYPQFVAAPDTLTTSFNNIGALLHPVPTLLNIGWIEKEGVFFKYYYDSISPTIAKFLEKVDAERVNIARKLGVNAVSLKDWMCSSYDIKASSLYEAFQKNVYYKTIDAPKTINHRYIFEDVPTGLVPLESTGLKLGLPVNNIKLVIDQASALLDYDFRANGRTFKNLGMETIKLDDLKSIIVTGVFND